MNTIKDIFTEYPNSWIQCLPKYQQNVINELYSQLGDYNQVATSWLNASMPMNVPFGTEKGHSIFYEKVLDEIEAFFSGDERYKGNRLAILKESGAAQNFIVGSISVALAPILGTSSAFLAPVIAIILVTIAKIGINAWLAARKEKHNSDSSNS